VQLAVSLLYSKFTNLFMSQLFFKMGLLWPLHNAMIDDNIDSTVNCFYFPFLIKCDLILNSGLIFIFLNKTTFFSFLFHILGVLVVFYLLWIGFYQASLAVFKPLFLSVPHIAIEDSGVELSSEQMTSSCWWKWAANKLKSTFLILRKVKKDKQLNSIVYIPFLPKSS
jgi:hypothetical protein